MRATRHNPQPALAKDAHGTSLLIGWPDAQDFDLDRLPRQCPLDEYRLAPYPCDATAFMVDGLNGGGWHRKFSLLVFDGALEIITKREAIGHMLNQHFSYDKSAKKSRKSLHVL
jgi:hypothetical protein